MSLYGLDAGRRVLRLIWREEQSEDVQLRLLQKLYRIKPKVLFGAAFSILLLGGGAGVRVGDPWIIASAAFSSACAIWLACSLIRKPLPAAPSPEEARVAEYRFTLSSWLCSAGIGATCARALLASPDMLVHFMAIVLSIASMAMVVRNYFRPHIVIGQLICAYGPTAIALVLHATAEYIIVEIGGMALFYTMLQVVFGLHSEASDSLIKDELVRKQNIRFDAAINNMVHGLVMFGPDGRLLVHNRRFMEIYGFSPDYVRPGASLSDGYAHCEKLGHKMGRSHEEVLRKLGRGGELGHLAYRNQLADGRTVSVALQGMAGGGWVAIHEDITERLAAERQIEYMACHDPLTGLANRILFDRKLNLALASVSRDNPVAVLCLDLDRFKTVNDTLGHAMGDELLKEVATRLRSGLREKDVVARLGGDEFSIVQVGAAQPEGATLLANRIIEALSSDFIIRGHRINIGTSVGIALAPPSASDVDQLLREADLALYRAKSQGRGQFRFFTAEMDDDMQARRLLEMDLRKALSQHQFELAYQPLVTLETGRIAGFEALLRWNHPTRGVVMPNDFIPLAEEIGLIVPIGEWVLRHACLTAVHWPKDIAVSVNLSPAQFVSGDIGRTIDRALSGSGLEPHRLELEITEGLLLASSGEILETLHDLRSKGVRIAMDDFGTGYSSLSYLQSFPFDRIKIDRSFVQNLSHGGQAVAIVRAIAGLGKSLGIATTAEGIETMEQLNQLRAEGCSEVQGYLLGRPMTAASASRRILQQVQERDAKAA